MLRCTHRHNSTFQVKPRSRSGVIKQKAPLRSTVRAIKFTRGRRLNPAGKKAKLREQINRRNRVRFIAMGLYDVCEIQGPQCWNKDYTWMHGKKDRLLTMHEREFLVVRACTVCHNEAELSGHENMLRVVTETIKKRSNRTWHVPLY